MLEFRYKVSMPYWPAYLNWTPMFEWYVVGCGSKNGHHKDMCLEEIRLRAQNMIIILAQ